MLVTYQHLGHRFLSHANDPWNLPKPGRKKVNGSVGIPNLVNQSKTRIFDGPS